MKRTVVILFLAARCCVAELITVAPEGNTQSRFPFGLEVADLPSMRYQQVYASDAFLGLLGQQGGTITEIRFYSDENNLGGFSSTLSDVQIDFSITPRGPDQLSEVFSENLGINTETVFGRGELTLSARLPGFAVLIPLETPYFYDPSLGNLLLDVRNFQPNSIDDCPFGVGERCAPPFDATGFQMDQISMVWWGDVNGPVGNPNTSGLVTTFDITPIPEPSTWMFLLAGLGIGATWKRMAGRSTAKVAERNQPPMTFDLSFSGKADSSLLESLPLRL